MAEECSEPHRIANGCFACGWPMDGASRVGTCPECRAKVRAALYAYRKNTVPGLVDFGESPYHTSGGNPNTLPIELLEGLLYVGGRLSMASLPALQQAGVQRVFHLADDQDDPNISQAAARMLDYRFLRERDSVYDVFDQMIQVVRHGTRIALYGVHPHATWRQSKGVILLIAVLMVLAGLSVHESKELLRERCIIGPAAYGGDTTKRVDDLADLFAAMHA